MSWQGVVVHHSASHDSEGLNLDDIRGWHRERGWRDIGYHAVVERIETSYAFLMARPWTMVGSHAPGYNATHLGVCFVGDFTATPPTDEQLAVGAQGIASLLVCLGLTAPDPPILAHRDTKATACPGDVFPIEELRSRVAALVAGSEV